MAINANNSAVSPAPARSENDEKPVGDASNESTNRAGSNSKYKDTSTSVEPGTTEYLDSLKQLVSCGIAGKGQSAPVSEQSESQPGLTASEYLESLRKGLPGCSAAKQEDSGEYQEMLKKLIECAHHDKVSEQLEQLMQCSPTRGASLQSNPDGDKLPESTRQKLKHLEKLINFGPAPRTSSQCDVAGTETKESPAAEEFLQRLQSLVGCDSEDTPQPDSSPEEYAIEPTRDDYLFGELISCGSTATGTADDSVQLGKGGSSSTSRVGISTLRTSSSEYPPQCLEGSDYRAYTEEIVRVDDEMPFSCEESPTTTECMAYLEEFDRGPAPTGAAPVVEEEEEGWGYIDGLPAFLSCGGVSPKAVPNPACDNTDVPVSQKKNRHPVFDDTGIPSVYDGNQGGYLDGLCGPVDKTKHPVMDSFDLPLVEDYQSPMLYDSDLSLPGDGDRSVSNSTDRPRLREDEQSRTDDGDGNPSTNYVRRFKESIEKVPVVGECLYPEKYIDSAQSKRGCNASKCSVLAEHTSEAGKSCSEECAGGSTNPHLVSDCRTDPSSHGTKKSMHELIKEVSSLGSCGSLQCDGKNIPLPDLNATNKLRECLEKVYEQVPKNGAEPGSMPTGTSDPPTTGTQTKNMKEFVKEVSSLGNCGSLPDLNATNNVKMSCLEKLDKAREVFKLPFIKNRETTSAKEAPNDPQRCGVPWIPNAIRPRRGSLDSENGSGDEPQDSDHPPMIIRCGPCRQHREDPDAVLETYSADSGDSLNMPRFHSEPVSMQEYLQNKDRASLPNDNRTDYFRDPPPASGWERNQDSSAVGELIEGLQSKTLNQHLHDLRPYIVPPTEKLSASEYCPELVRTASSAFSSPSRLSARRMERFRATPTSSVSSLAKDGDESVYTTRTARSGRSATSRRSASLSKRSKNAKEIFEKMSDANVVVVLAKKKKDKEEKTKRDCFDVLKHSSDEILHEIYGDKSNRRNVKQSTTTEQRYGPRTFSGEHAQGSLPGTGYPSYGYATGSSFRVKEIAWSKNDYGPYYIPANDPLGIPGEKIPGMLWSDTPTTASSSLGDGELRLDADTSDYRSHLEREDPVMIGHEKNGPAGHEVGGNLSGDPCYLNGGNDRTGNDNSSTAQEVVGSIRSILNGSSWAPTYDTSSFTKKYSHNPKPLGMARYYENQ